MTPLILALDFGDSRHIAAVAAPGDRRWRAYRRALAPPHSSALVHLAIIRSMVRDLLQGNKPAAIGVSFSGPIDSATGLVPLTHPAAGWANVPLRRILEKEYRVPVVVDTESKVAALGEHRFGAGRGYGSLLYISAGNDIRGGWILQGQPWNGADGMAGLLGQMLIDPQGTVCTSGKPGCLDCFVAEPFIAQRMRDQLQAQTDRGHVLRQLIGNQLDSVTGRRVREAAALGDQLSWELLERAAWALGVAIGNTANLVNPQRFILGGDVTKSGERFWATIRKTARQTALDGVNFDVVPASLGDDAALWGAVAMGEKVIAGVHSFLNHTRSAKR